MKKNSKIMAPLVTAMFLALCCANGEETSVNHSSIAMVSEDAASMEACVQCATQSCTDYKGIDVYDACHGAPSAVLCQEMVACAIETGCPIQDENGNAWSDFHPYKCYCGTASISDCMAGAGNGQCKAKVEAAAETTDPMEVATRFADPNYAVGDAMRLILCGMNTCPSCLE